MIIYCDLETVNCDHTINYKTNKKRYIFDNQTSKTVRNEQKTAEKCHFIRNG